MHPVRSGIVFLLMILVVAPLHAAEPGVETGTYIEQEVSTQSGAGQPAMKGKQRTWFTPNHIRNETVFETSTSVAIIDLAAGRIVLMPSDEKQYVEMKLADYQRIVSMRLAGSGLGDPEANPKLDKTDERKQIGDWLCTKYVFEQAGAMPIRSVMWVSTEAGIDFSFFLDLMAKLGMEKMLGKLSGFVSSIEGYPIRIETEQHIHGQKLTTTHQVVRVAVGPVDPRLFEIPKEYQRVGGDALNQP